MQHAITVVIYMAKIVCANCGTENAKKWIKEKAMAFCSGVCKENYEKKGGPGGTCEFC